jgi:hypothetical protein
MPGKHHKLEEVQKIAKLKGGICLSKTYKRATDKLEFKCSEGHVFHKDFKRILHKNEWCQKCGRNTSEEVCRYVFESLLNIKFEKTIFNYKGHNLELDGYNKNKSIAFEYNGKQHYELTTYIKAKKELDYRKYLDKLKIEYCKAHKINLIVIPYTIQNDDLPNHIKSVLNIENSKEIDIDSFINGYSYYKNRKQEIEKTILNKNGRLLKFNLDSIEVTCGNGHIWTTKYYVIKKGHWCKLCANSNRVRSFSNENIARKPSDIKNTLKKEGITCVNESDYKNGKTVLTFKCKNNHTFTDTVDYLLARIAGRNKENNRKPCQLCNRVKQDSALEKIKLNGLTLVNPGEYKHRTDLLKWICEHGHKQEDKAKNLLQNIRRGAELCKTCKN